VFTARYALSPYIKQICFIFKGLNINAVQYSVNFLVLSRTEHAQHSPSCLFVKIGKRECDMTLNDLLDLHLERTKNLMVCIFCSSMFETCMSLHNLTGLSHWN
jgi:hypothetical protein